jgi:hypothetical protein
MNFRHADDRGNGPVGNEVTNWIGPSRPPTPREIVAG